MIAFFVTETGSTAGIKSYTLRNSFNFVSLLKERPIMDSKGILVANNLWSITTNHPLDSGQMIQIASRRYKVKSTVEGMSGMRKVILEAQP